METIFSHIIWGINIALALYFSISALYFLVFAIGAKFYKEKKITKTADTKHNVSILIPAYKEDSIIIESALSANNHKSKHYIEVTVIADKLQETTVEKLSEIGVQVHKVTFKKSTKAKSINSALETLSAEIDTVIILDADNIMKEGFVDTIISKMDLGFSIIQGHRTAKNNNTSFSVLDGISEEVNNAIFRKGHRVLGLSAAIIGSGFACKAPLFKDLMKQATAVGGFDKELELLILKNRISIGYAKSAVIFDEKIQKADAFVNQRRRWISAQLIYFAKGIKDASIDLLKNGNVDLFDKTIQFILPPRIIALGISFLASAIQILLILFSSNQMFFEFNNIWIGAFIITMLAVIGSIPLHMFSKKLLQAAFAIPKGFFLTVKSFLQLKGANKQFIHTAHSKID